VKKATTSKHRPNGNTRTAARSSSAESSAADTSDATQLQRLKASLQGRHPSRPLTARAVAELCGVELKTVHNWAAEGLIGHFRTPGRHLRFQAEAVVRFLDDCGYRLSESETVGSALVLAHGSVRSQLRRALKGLPTEWIDKPLSALVMAGKTQPDAVVVESSLLADVSPNLFFTALSHALPKARLYCLGGNGRAPGASTRVDLKDMGRLRAELGLSPAS
jgi:excisionase family DNA binding protein